MRCRDDAVCSVACLAWVCGERGAMRPTLWPHRSDDILWKPHLQKRLRIGSYSVWKTPRQSIRVSRGLQCGLSGNRVLRTGDGAARGVKGNCPFGDEGFPAGKANPT